MNERLTKNDVFLKRNPLRLRGYDYSQAGTYFVTTNTHNRVCWFGDIDDCVMRLSEIGQIVSDQWKAIPAHHPGVELDAFVVMPNHLHGIVHILDRGSSIPPGDTAPAPTRAQKVPKRSSLSTIMGSFKAGVSRRVTAVRSGHPVVLWQAGYQDHIVRTDGELDRIRSYIAANPARWPSDPENPERTAAATQGSPPQGQAPDTDHHEWGAT
jgi:putative transposase